MGERRFSRVAVLKGGFSSEREVSLVSGAAAASALREGGYSVTEEDVASEDFRIPEGTEAVFIALHGRFGEDGGVQERLASAGIPFTGSGAASSRVSFDKVLTREVLSAAGIPVARGEVLRAAEERTLAVPLVLKPPREGSSVGCRLVFEEADFAAAFADAQRFSPEVLAEAYVAGRELTVGVVCGQALPAVEIIPKAAWYDYRAKYQSGDTTYVCPAALAPETAAVLESIALQTFDALGADTFGRVDFRLTPENEPFVLELNAIPGLTSTSLLPKAAAAAGIGFSELCCRIMECAHL